MRFAPPHPAPYSTRLLLIVIIIIIIISRTGFTIGLLVAFMGVAGPRAYRVSPAFALLLGIVASGIAGVMMHWKLSSEVLPLHPSCRCLFQRAHPLLVCCCVMTLTAPAFGWRRPRQNSGGCSAAP